MKCRAATGFAVIDAHGGPAAGMIDGGFLNSTYEADLKSWPRASRQGLDAHPATTAFNLKHPSNRGLVQNVIFIESADFFAGPWKTASMLLPSGSMTNAA